MRGAALAAVVFVALVAAACGDGSSGSASGVKVTALADAMEAAKTARYEGMSIVPDPPGVVDASGTPEISHYSGEIDFTRRASTFESPNTGPEASGTSHSIRIGTDEWFNEGEPADPDVPPSDPSKPWTHMYVPDAAIATPDLTDFRGVADEMERAGAHPEDLGRDTVRGVTTEHVRFVAPTTEIPRQLATMGLARPGANRYDLWVDSEQRVRRIRMSLSDGQLESEDEFFDFGTPVTIEPPPADQVHEEAVDATLTGDWAVAREGRAGEVPWRLYRAPTADGYCFAVATNPPSPLSGVEAPQRGRSPDTCQAAGIQVSSPPAPMPDMPPPGSISDYEVPGAAVWLPNRMVLLYGQVVPGTRTVTLTYDDGHTRREVPENGMFAVVLQPDELVRTAALDVAGKKVTCRLDATIDFMCSEDVTSQSPPNTMPPGEVPDGQPIPAP